MQLSFIDDRPKKVLALVNPPEIACVLATSNDRRVPVGPDVITFSRREDQLLRQICTQSDASFATA